MEELENIWRHFLQTSHIEENWWERKKKSMKQRRATIQQIDVQGRMHSEKHHQYGGPFVYDVCMICDIDQDGHRYTEEIHMPFQFEIKDGEIINHVPIKSPKPTQAITVMKRQNQTNSRPDTTFTYDRDAAVAYANKWWNSYNPSYETFRVDCTNYVSQCLHAGGAPMHGYPVREEGWWYQAGTWSFSWSVSHSLRWYLQTSRQGLTATEVTSPQELMPGDIICYDFEGDGRWDHSTIVVAKDKEDMPLVNAHTDNSKNRYWKYEDSRAWTNRTTYTFFRIGNA